MSNKTLIAICGKSCAGKDTTAKALCEALEAKGITAHLIVSDTTRPKRPNEVDGVDYHFIDDHEFSLNELRYKYIEDSNFNGWFYGTPESELREDAINIGVFNPEGIMTIIRRNGYMDKYDFLHIVHLDASWVNRFFRYWKRQGRLTCEQFRRFWYDHKDFAGFGSKMRNLLQLGGVNGLTQYLVFKNQKIDSICSEIIQHVVYVEEDTAK